MQRIKIFNNIVIHQNKRDHTVNFQQLLTDNPAIIPVTVFGIALIVQLYYYLVVYRKFLYSKPARVKRKQDPVSVIICARNEAENLDANLPAVLTQKYPDYEVIVVNDCSNDHTDEILGKYLKKYKHLHTTNINEDKKFAHGKKLAVTIGVKAAKNDILVFTDADCQPVSNLWLARMQRNFTEKKAIVLGYGGYYTGKSLLNNYIRYETLMIAMQYFSYARSGHPYMGVGRNLAYRKSLFFANKGFASHYHLLSGDDDLFVNETANKENTAVEFSAESHTRSLTKRTVGEWIKQKRRHLTTSRYYKSKHKFLLGTELFSRFLYYGMFIYLLVNRMYPDYILPAFGLRLALQIVFTKKAMKLLNEKNLLLSSLFFDVFSLLTNFTLFITNQLRFKRRRQWK